MATVSKDKKKTKKTLKEDFEARDITPTSIWKIVIYSVNGIKAYAREGKSIIIYAFCSLMEIIMGIIFNIDGKEWILIICALGIILSIELVNTAIEKVCDAVTKEYNELIKDSKDCGSAATFVIFIVILILNLIIFYPKIAALF